MDSGSCGGKTSNLIMARDYQIQRKSAASKSGIDYRKELNDEQYNAVSSPDGRALVIAGAGSGKTRTLTYRVAWLLDHEVEARNILLLTFTNKAAKEMISRVRELVSQDTSDLWAGTFHSIGSRILRRHAEEFGFTKSFTILDRDDQKSMMNSVVAACDINTKKNKFPKADVLAAMFSLVVNTGQALEDIVIERYPYFEDWLIELAQVMEAYIAKKEKTNSMDFDDLLVRTVALLKSRPDLLALYQKKFRHILVDEFQDTNHVQCELIELLEGEKNSLMVVGDDAQSIYSWRGADMANILDFPEKKPGSRQFTIETNYRSVPEILDLSNVAIRANKERFEKNLKASRRGGEMKPALVSVDDPTMQAEFVGQRILELQNEGVELDEIAILYRAHFQSMEVQMEMTLRGIPFAITSGLRFFEQAHIKDVSAFLRFVTNRRDEVAFKRLVQLLPGIGPGSADKMWGAWYQSGWAEKAELPTRFSDICATIKVPKKAEADWQQIGFILDEMTRNGAFARPSDMIYSVLEGMYDDYLKSTFDNYEQRKNDVDKLLEYGTTFDDVLVFLEQLSLMSNTDGDPAAKKKEVTDGPQVTMSSIHQAKGLEWKVVFLIWLAEGQFPNGRVLESEDDSMLEEERRLFYVAITRAKDQLYLLYPMINPKSYTGDIMQQPSRFLNDFPIDMIEEWNVGSSWTDDEAPF
jgi:DNA helicase II / ATP-dependent DNA helicase PcrA